jgi:hypothetical protein
VIARARKTLRRFDRRVWLLLFAMLAFRFGHGLYFPFSSIYFHNVLGIPLSLVGSFPWYLAVSAAHGFVGWSMFEASRNAMVADVTPLGRWGVRGNTV